jgi:two-component system, OmpR family, response regulator
MAPWWSRRPDNLLNASRVTGPGRAILNAVLPKLLIAEDDSQLRDVLMRTLREEGFEVRAVGTGTELLELSSSTAPDALIVDIGLPDSDGRDVCQALRSHGMQVPVLFLTARDALVDRLSGFGAGGDDYVTKPFDLEELVARLRALLRRGGAERAAQVAGLRLDPADHVASSGGQSVSLTPTEFRLIAALAAHEGKVVRRPELLRAAWPHGAIVHDNTLDVYIARLRRKLRTLRDAPEIGTVHGLGYRVE